MWQKRWKLNGTVIAMQHIFERLLMDFPVPSEEEISFVLEILDHIVAPALAKVEVLLEKSSAWTSIDRNDFCR